jgi:hypothetical protein
MSGAGLRVGDFVRSEPPQRRRTLTVLVRSPDDVLVGPSYLEAELGFTEAEAVAAKRDFAAVLHDLARRRASPRRDAEAAALPPDLREEQAARLDESDKWEFLMRLCKLGAGLRGKLSDDLADKLRQEGFPTDEGDEQPALDFVQAGAPVLWDMLYDGSLTELPDWRLFWGLRAPIAHWMVNKGAPASESIAAGNGLFSAISEDLCGGGPEAAALAELLEGPGLRHASLAQALRRQVLLEAGLPEAEPPGDDWLRGHLAAMNTAQREVWKNRALVRIFTSARDQYPLIHFACHCCAGGGELLSRLEMRVAGERLALEVALMAADLKGKPAGRKSGPLVFLNACGTAAPSAEPPGFPAVWIGYGALAVIATLCPVPDDFALAFARRFYWFLLKKARDPEATRYRYLAEALLATRRYFLEQYGNPLGLAYVLYARKGVHVQPEPAP